MNKTDTSTQLQEIKTETLERIRFALEASFREELNTTGFFAENTTWSIPAFGYENGDEPELLKYVETITETNDVRLAYAKVYEELEARKIKSSKEAQRPEEQQKTTINKDESAQLQEEAERRGEQIKQAEENAKKEVERAIENLEVLKQRKDQELKDLEVRGEKDKKYYAKVEATKIELTAQEQEVFTELKEIAKDNPQAAKEILIEIIEKNSGQSLRDLSLSKDEIKTVIEGTAAQVTENLHNFDNPNFVPQTHQTAILTDVAHKPEQYGKSISDSANNVATTHLLQYQIYKDVTTSTLGVNFANTVFGQSPDQVQISISDTPQAGYTQTFTPYSFVQSDRQTAADQSETLALVKDFGTDRGKQVLLGQAGKLIEKRMSLLAPQSTARRLLGTAEVKSLLFSRFGIGTPIQWTATNVVGKIALNFTPEYVPLISGVGKITGLNFGLVGRAVTTGVAKEAGKEVAVQASKEVVKKGATGFLAKIGATVINPLSAIPVVGPILSWLLAEVVVRLGGALLSKLKEFWTKNKDVLIPILAGGAGLAVFGPGVGLGIGVGSYILSRRIRAAAIGAWIWGFFTMIGSAFVVTIATPVIVTLLVLPPLVAFIMLVINNSAYLVPPKPIAESGFPPGGGGGYECREDRITTGLEYSVNSPIATRAREIVDDLYQGFWCFWNRSPKAPPPYFPNDEEPKYPPGYPEEFNYELFTQNPNADPTGGDDLFWCTWLVQKAYKENGVNIEGHLFSPDMKTDFELHHTYYEADSVKSDQILPGAVIFFDVKDNGKERIDHVAVVYSVSEDDITYVQSNAGLKVEHLTINSSGVGIQDNSVVDVVGIGLP